MESAITDRRAHRGGRENEVIEGGCCYAGSVGCPEGEFVQDLIQGLEERQRVVG